MSKIKATAFVVALADFLAAPAPAIKRTAPGIQLFANASDDAVAADCFSTLRHFDGEPAKRDGRLHLAIQCETLAKAGGGKSAAVRALEMAEDIHGRLQNEYGPLMQRTLAGFNLMGIVDLRPPRLVGGEVDQRQRAVFNFGVYYLPTGG